MEVIIIYGAPPTKWACDSWVKFLKSQEHSFICFLLSYPLNSVLHALTDQGICKFLKDFLQTWCFSSVFLKPMLPSASWRWFKAANTPRAVLHWVTLWKSYNPFMATQNLSGPQENISVLYQPVCNVFLMIATPTCFWLDLVWFLTKRQWVQPNSLKLYLSNHMSMISNNIILYMCCFLHFSSFYMWYCFPFKVIKIHSFG